jgi:hypothetical protein
MMIRALPCLSKLKHLRFFRRRQHRAASGCSRSYSTLTIRQQSNEPRSSHAPLHLFPCPRLLPPSRNPPFLCLSVSVCPSARPSVRLSFFLSFSFFHCFCFLFYFFDCFYFLNKLFLCFFFDCFCFRVLHDIEQSLAASVVSSSSTCQIILLLFGLLLLVVKLLVESSYLCLVFFYLL